MQCRCTGIHRDTVDVGAGGDADECVGQGQQLDADETVWAAGGGRRGGGVVTRGPEQFLSWQLTDY